MPRRVKLSQPCVRSSPAQPPDGYARGMPAPQTPYDAVLNAARDVSKLDCALDAEMLGTALLGSVYSVATTDRAAAVRTFVGDFLTATSRRRTASATTIRSVFAALVPDASGAADVKPGAAQPPWTAQL